MDDSKLGLAFSMAISLAGLFDPKEPVASKEDGSQCGYLDYACTSISYVAILLRVASEVGDPALFSIMHEMMDSVCDGTSMLWASEPGRTREDLRRMFRKASQVKLEPGRDG